MSNIKLEVGKTYRNRIGEKVRIVEKDGGDGKYPYTGDDGEWYAEDGRYFYHFLGDAIYDLVKEVKGRK